MSFLARILTKLIVAAAEDVAIAVKRSAQRARAEQAAAAQTRARRETREIAEKTATARTDASRRWSGPVTPAVDRPSLEETFVRDHPVARFTVEGSATDVTTRPLKPSERLRARKEILAAMEWPFFPSLPAHVRSGLAAAARRVEDPDPRCAERSSTTSSDTCVEAASRARQAHTPAERRRTRDDGKGASQLWSDAELEIEAHWHALRRRLRRAVTRNAYGVIAHDGRREVFEEFLASSDLEAPSLAAAATLFRSTLRRLQREDDSAARSGLCEKMAPENGRAFISWISDHVQRLGWRVRPLPDAGTHGIHLIAVIEGVEVGIQCRRWKRPIGHRAVEAIHLGAQHMWLRRGVIVATSGFTRRAEELGESTGVLLLDVEDLASLEQLIAFPPPG